VKHAEGAVQPSTTSSTSVIRAAVDKVPGPPERVLKQVPGIGFIFDH
jgi:hypothetical protein